MAGLPSRNKSLPNIFALAGVVLAVAVSLAEAEFKCHNKIDLVILMDSSGSITRQQFKIGQKFAADLVKHFDVSKEKTNVAVASYSQYAYTARTFQDHASQEMVLKAIHELKYEGAASRLDFGFDLVEFKLFDKKYGARNKGVKRVAVFITDGYSTRGVEFTRDSAAKLTATKGVKLFSVGISDRVDKVELDELASKPRKAHQLITKLKENSLIEEQVERFAKQICKNE